MNELDFLNNEARIASAIGKNVAARLLTRSEALACIMGAGGAFAVCVKH